MASAPHLQRAPVVLVVEPEKEARRTLADWLEVLGYRALPAAGGLEAVELYRRHWHEVVVAFVNWHLADFDGAQTLAALQTFRPTLPCCFLVAGQDPAVLAESKALSGWPPLQTPCILPEVAAMLTVLNA